MQVQIELATALKARDAMPRLIRETISLIDQTRKNRRPTTELEAVLHRERAALADLEDATGFDTATGSPV